ncbi:hypothetical protein [Halorhodospira halophila]|uniref:Uncharacterized protein n=1 Tax=Halorhodospira halophila (strain DSM 244 / SL1) TaxID=349124 RepID=A1WT88_HALHL|nr:hypothetical protein [Halorhodospira halophila]ABM60900.1 hypothetical protein Hhal_0106 [Halorhodospira halophila SL1]MBK1728557.1 hypothetical protein [Halorhodospira halophila]
MSRSDLEPDQFGRAVLEQASAQGFALPDDPDLAAALANLESAPELSPEVAEAIAALLEFAWATERDAGGHPAVGQPDHPEGSPSPRPGP